MLKSVTPSDRTDKRYKATFRDGKEIHFGLKNPKDGTYIDHGSKAKRSAYRARHHPNEHWNQPKTAGSLARHILWGNSTSLKANIDDFNRMFK